MKTLKQFTWATFSIALIASASGQVPADDTPFPISNGSQEVATNPPSVVDREFCQNEVTPFLTVSGTSIKWYDSDGYSSGDLYDSRDMKTYETVVIGNQIWMAENLNYGTMINGADDSRSGNGVEKYCLDNNSSKCDEFGGLYQWNEVMNYTNYEESQGICPTGWHIPSNDEWVEMEIYLGAIPSEANTVGKRGSNVNITAKMIPGGSSGFDVLWAGKRDTDGTFKDEAVSCSFWSSTEDYLRLMKYSWDYITLSDWPSKEKGFSVRCIKNANTPIHTGNTYYPGISAPGTYTYYVTQTIGGTESARVPIRLTIHPAASVQISGPASGCEGSEVVLDAGAGYKTYSWGGIGSNRELMVTATGNYQVTVEDYNNCTATDNHYVTINSKPNVSISGENQACEGESLVLDAGAGYKSYSWGSLGSSRELMVSETGNYQVTVVDYNNCSATDQHYVTFNNRPSVSISGENQACKGETVVLNAGTGYTSFLWSTGAITNTINVTDDGTYTVTVTDGNQCQNSDSHSLSFIECQTNTKPRIDPQSFSVSENSDWGEVVGRIHATDIDEGQTISYQIVAGNGDGSFVLNPQSGDLKVNDPSALNFEYAQKAELDVMAQDDGDGFLSDTATITVHIMDINEPPIFNDQNFEIDEGMPRFTYVGTLQSEDEDFGQRISYEILGGNISNAFRVDPFTGTVTVNNPEVMDYDLYPRFKLSISAFDDAAESLSTEAFVEISLLKPLGLEIPEAGPLSTIYPNPTRGTVFLEADLKDNQTIFVEVFSANGLKIKSVEVSDIEPNQPFRIDLSGYLDGLLTIKVSYGPVYEIHKVVKYRD